MYFNPKEIAADENTSPELLSKLALESVELARIVAKNPNTDPQLLIQLSVSKDTAICEGVASNPNTPTEILLKLGEKFPKQ